MPQAWPIIQPANSLAGFKDLVDVENTVGINDRKQVSGNSSTPSVVDKMCKLFYPRVLPAVIEKLNPVRGREFGFGQIHDHGVVESLNTCAPWRSPR